MKPDLKAIKERCEDAKFKIGDKIAYTCNNVETVLTVIYLTDKHYLLKTKDDVEYLSEIGRTDKTYYLKPKAKDHSIQDLLAYVEKLEGLVEKAIQYIELSPGDPDVFPDQYTAYKEYQNAKIEAGLTSNSDKS